MATGNPGISGQSSGFIPTPSGGAPIQTGGQQPTPDVRFSGDIMAVLKKMDILRLERNNKRAERRTAGEANVSDDEEDDLTPYYLGNVSGGSPLPNVGTAAAPQVTGNAPTVPNVVAANSKVLFTDQKAANNSFRANDNTIPNAIFSLAKNGISPPLTLFLPISLDRIRSSNVKTVKHGTGETDVSDFPDETVLEQAPWTTCYNTFLGFFDQAAESHIVRGFSLHYNNILSDAALDTWFPAYRSFDRQIRAQFFTEPYIIDVQSAEYRNALQSAKDNHMWSSVHSPSSSGSRSGAPSGRERGERPKPYDRDTQPQSDGGASRRRSVLCFRCGRTGHPAGRCPEKNPNRHGREFVIYANRDGLFRLSDNRAVCMLFNCGRCESQSGPKHAVHVCALCGDANHGAANCTRIVTPYHAAGWSKALGDCNLLTRYPNLVHDISFGSPIGNPPSPSFTFTPPMVPAT
ncbi:hypothetical protein C8R46DRAFT_885221 [Mycena filopes]|nr:hypothetical protein C8R46DRAFT_885221 [Mycena filopes]